MCFKSESKISPIALITKNMKKPIIAYVKIMDVPETLIVFPDPINRPVPIAPPIAIS
ncbi:hypothetical protein D3C79_799860 [compost metagenome]